MKINANLIRAVLALLPGGLTVEGTAVTLHPRRQGGFDRQDYERRVYLAASRILLDAPAVTEVRARIPDCPRLLNLSHLCRRYIREHVPALTDQFTPKEDVRRPWPQAAPAFTSFQIKTANVLAHFEARGRETICVIVTGPRTSRNVAICAPGDRYDRALGCLIAMRRALLPLRLSDEVTVELYEQLTETLTTLPSTHAPRG
jgi:hypothetical protein